MTIVHPCGSLPVTGHHISMWWCDHHQCWWATLSVVRQSQQEPATLRRDEHQFGPFDRTDEVLAVIHRWLDAYVRSPDQHGAPAAR